MEPVRNGEKVRGLMPLQEQMRQALVDIEQLAERQLSPSEIEHAIDAIIFRMRDAIEDVVNESGQLVPILRV